MKNLTKTQKTQIERFCGMTPVNDEVKLTANMKAVKAVAEKYAGCDAEDLVLMAKGRLNYHGLPNLVSISDRFTAIAVLEGIR